MGKINRYLKTVFAFFNILFTGFGAFMIYDLLSTGFIIKMKKWDGWKMIWSWVCAIGIFGVSLLGSHAARKENKSLLKVFAGFMGTGIILTLIIGIYVVFSRNQVIESVTESNPKFRNHPERLIKMIMGICFGLVSIAIMGLIISINMIHQISVHDRKREPVNEIKAN